MIYAAISSLTFAIQITNTFKLITMRNYISDNALTSSPKLKIDTQTLQSIPPGCQKQQISGIFTLRIETNYLNTLRQKHILRCRLWGMQEETIFEQYSQTQKIINLNLRSSIENITKYFQDMNVVCIEVLTGLKKDREGDFQKKKGNSDFKQIGWIFVNPQRYVINHVLNDFEQTVNIIDLRKQKIGEATVKLSIKMYEKQKLFLSPSQPQIKRPTSLNEIPFPALAENKNLYQKIPPPRDSNPYGEVPQKQDKYRQLLRQNQKDLANSHSQGGLDEKWQRDNFLPEFRKKSRAEQFLQQYNKSKPIHTELSLLRDKYGYNHPSVQVMKLKYDEVKLLSNFSQIQIKEDSRINLLLKSIKSETKNKIQYLTIYCEDRSRKLKTETKIVLSESNGSKVQINHLYMLPNSSQDLLTLQIKDGKAEIQAVKLTRTDKVEFKNKNGKKVAVLDFIALSNQHIQDNRIHSNHQQSRNDNRKPFSPQTEVQQLKKHKQSGYICVLNWPSDKISLKNTNFGITSACKLLFEMKEVSSDVVQVILENNKKEAEYLQIELAYLFKEQNYFIDGRQVKIISCRGNTSQILSLIDKLQPERQEAKVEAPENTEKLKQNQQQLQNIKNFVVIVEHLSRSQQVECNQIIEQLATSNKISTQKIEKLAQIIQVDPKTFLKVINETFKGNFSDFFKMFQIYHRWNHKYIFNMRKLKRIIEPFERDILRMVKKLKKGNDVLFGALPSNILINQFIKLDSEHAEGEFDHESLGRLFALLFQRYSPLSIKISQIQSFIHQNQVGALNLNIYTLCKMAFQIQNDPESFHQSLTEQQVKFLNIFKTQKQFSGELGLSKLLFAPQEEDLTESQISSHYQEHNRKDTERAFNVCTEQSKQAIDREEEHRRRLTSKQSERQQITQKQLQKSKQIKRIPIVLNRIQLQNGGNFNKIIIFNQNQEIPLVRQQDILPKAILLVENSVYTISLQGYEKCEGVFVAINRPQRIKLYNDHSEQTGILYLFDENKTETEESEIPFTLVTTHKAFKSEQLNSLRQQLQNDSSLLIKDLPMAKSPQVKLTLRSITPTRPKFQFKITSQNHQKTTILEYPDENQVILNTSEDGWNIRLINEDFEEILVPNAVGSNTYCFTNSSDKKVAYMAIIEISQNWNADQVRAPQESLHIFCHLEQLISLQNLKESTFDFILLQNQTMTELSSISVPSQSKRITIGSCFALTQTGDQIEIKVIQKRTKQLMAEFEFTLRLIKEKVQRGEKYLISKHDGFRLKITVYQLKHQWNHCRFDRILSLFNNPVNKKTIESYLLSTSFLDQQSLTTWLKSNFQLALGEIDIMLNQLLSNKDGRSWVSFLKLFEKQTYQATASDVLQQFQIFDLSEEGTISMTQMSLVKRILQKNYKKTSKLLNQFEHLFISSSVGQNNFIIDLSNTKEDVFDYLGFMSFISDESPKREKKEKTVVNRQKGGKNSKYLKIGIISFHKLSINGAPSTLLFKIKGERLADPIHRCYSFTYTNPFTVNVQNQQNINLEIYCQRLNAEGQWEYKLIQTVPVAEEVKILGGVINLTISEIDAKGEQKRVQFSREDQKNVDLQPFSTKKAQAEKEEENNLQRSDFQKSYWNKSLNQTRQRWAKGTETGSKQKRRVVGLKKSEIQKKLAIFDKFYEE